jgi:hypothetical protein
MLFNGNSSGFNTNLPVGDAAVLDSRVFGFNYTTFFNLLGRANQISFTLPAGTLSGNTTGATPTAVDVAAKGRADPVAFWNVNLVGAPAMSLAEYAQWEQRTLFDFNLYVVAPLGVYDEDRILNVGTGRWTIRIGAPFIQSFGPFVPGRRTTLELIPSVAFFTDREQLGNTVSQDPVFRVEGHITRDLTPELFISIDAGWQSGGATTVAGVDQDNAQSSVSLGLSVGYQISETFSMTSSWGNTLTDPEDGLNMNMVRFKFTYGWNPTAQAMAAQQPE